MAAKRLPFLRIPACGWRRQAQAVARLVADDGQFLLQRASWALTEPERAAGAVGQQEADVGQVVAVRQGPLRLARVRGRWPAGRG